MVRSFPLMKSATESLAEKVNSIQISKLKYPVISNFDGKLIKSSELNIPY